MRAACLRMGQLLNQAELGRDVALPQATVHRYLNLLETSYLLVRLPAYAVNRTKRLIKSPKVYWGDTGVALHLTQEYSPRGAHLENIVLHDLLTWRNARLTHAEIFYWRTAIGEEVDFVIEAGERLLPIEINSTGRPRLRRRGQSPHFPGRVWGNRQGRPAAAHWGDAGMALRPMFSPCRGGWRSETDLWISLRPVRFQVLFAHRRPGELGESVFPGVRAQALALGVVVDQPRYGAHGSLFVKPWDYHGASMQQFAVRPDVVSQYRGPIGHRLEENQSESFVVGKQDEEVRPGVPADQLFVGHLSGDFNLVAQTVAFYKAVDGLGVAFVAAHQHQPHRLTEPRPGLPVDLQQPELGLMPSQPAYTQDS